MIYIIEWLEVIYNIVLRSRQWSFFLILSKGELKNGILLNK